MLTIANFLGIVLCVYLILQTLFISLAVYLTLKCLRSISFLDTHYMRASWWGNEWYESYVIRESVCQSERLWRYLSLWERERDVSKLVMFEFFQDEVHEKVVWLQEFRRSAVIESQWALLLAKWQIILHEFSSKDPFIVKQATSVRADLLDICSAIKSQFDDLPNFTDQLLKGIRRWRLLVWNLFRFGLF